MFGGCVCLFVFNTHKARGNKLSLMKDLKKKKPTNIEHAIIWHKNFSHFPWDPKNISSCHFLWQVFLGVKFHNYFTRGPKNSLLSPYFYFDCCWVVLFVCFVLEFVYLWLFWLVGWLFFLRRNNLLRDHLLRVHFFKKMAWSIFKKQTQEATDCYLPNMHF